MSILKTENLVKIYGEGPNKIKALDNVSIEVNDGEFVAIIGTSGSGKSTLLNMLGGLDTPTSGETIINGKKISSMKDEELTVFRRRNIGFIFQNYNLVPILNVYENIVLSIELDGVKIDKEYVDSIINTLGLREKLTNMPNNLSGGQQQRVAIARALALEPKILLCDEATSALDPKITKDILALLSKINKELGITIVIVTHQMEVVKEVCERVALIDGGIVKDEGRAEDLFLKPGASLKKFLGEGDETTLPNEGINIRIFFPADCSENALITRMAREANVDFSIVWGKLEKFRENVLGSLVINIEEKDKETISDYLKSKNIEWEVI